MQLVDQKKRSNQEELSPAIYAALVYSLFQNPAPMFAGVLCAAIAAVMTAIKTGNVWLWPCAVLLVVTGALRAVDMDQYQRRKPGLTEAEAGHWEIRYQVGAMFYALALGTWVMGLDILVGYQASLLN